MSRSPRDPTEVKQRKYNQNPWTPLFDSGVYISESEDGLIESLSEGFLHKLILIMPPSRPVTSSHRGRKKLIRPSSASANLHCYSISVLDNGQRPATAATSGLLSDKPQRPTTQAGGSRKQWEPPKEDTSFIEAAKQPRRLTLGAVDGILELESIKRPGNIQGSVSQQLKNKIEEQINIETLEQLKQAFAEADANQSGQLDLEEFKALLKQRLYIKGNKRIPGISTVLLENQIDSLFMKIDWSSEGVISWDEFCTYMQLEYAEKEDSYLRSKEVSFHLPAKIQNPQHKNPILKITDTQDGTFIACSQDGMVTFWGANVELKETKYVVNTEAKNKQKTKWITDFVIMAQWKKVLVGTGDREIQFFDASSYKPYCQISSLETVPLKLDYCATGSDECLILYGDSDGCINILVINSVGECLRTWNKLPSKEGFIAEISLSDAISKSKIQFIRWKVHRDWVQQLKYYHEIGQVISCSNHQETALVIGCTSGSTRVDQGGNSNAEKAKKTNARVRLDADQKVFYVYKGVKCFDFSKDKNIIVTGGMDRIVRLWNPYVSDKPTAMLRGHNAPIFYLFIANDENRVFSLSTDKCIKVWDILDHNCLLTVRPKGHKIRGDLQACHYSSAAKSIAIATDQMAILNLKLKPTKHADITITHKEPVTCVRFNPSFKQVITCSESSVIKLWDLETGTPIFEYGDAHGDSAITCMTFDNTGRRLITGGRDGILKIWNYNNGHCLKVLKKEDDNDEICDITYVEMNRNRYVVSVGWDKRINIYSDSVTDVNIHHVQHPNPNWSDDLKHGHNEDILSVAQCPPNLLATSGYDGEVIVWNMVSGHIFCHLSAPIPREYEDQSLDGDLSINKLLFIQSRAYNKDSASLIASGPRAHIHFWNVFQGGTLMAQFPGSTTKGAMISTMAITDTAEGNEDDIMLIVGDSFGFIFLFDISGYCLMAAEEDPPELIHTWRGHIDSITCIELVEKHKLLMTASNDCTVRLWNFDGDYIGTFGQPDSWDIYKPSTYRHPMVPYDVLIDPMSLPTHPVIEEKQNTQQIIHEGENGHLKAPQFTFKKEQFYIDDDQIAKELHKLQSILKDESLTEEQAKAYKGKWLRHEKTKIKEIDRGGPSDYQMLKWSPIQEPPVIPKPKSMKKNKDDSFDITLEI
ncbi:cilia- and flagella-associated protein 337 isoform X2 [Magallana gigas]|uniref:cilia- and flagella-associated protein 337 isoform X2 n=1 Tax=Magallana gigas TaxID=29159 RepID=UPI0005C374C4|nr:WD repeat-containing protein on Y chromosome isoform X5 [Crassostrea gigas]|eukprot:XP_011445499.1 PREDICTED: WD repeat-containing protein on Y chromosome isoform X5 [Crassostrea gigas]